MAKVYRFRASCGYSGNDRAQSAGEFLDKLAQSGPLTAKSVVHAARPRSCPIHDLFEWDDSKAALQHRLSQARHLIRSVEVVVETVQGEPKRIQGFVHIGEPRSGEGQYHATVRAMRSPKMREEILARALREADLWRNRYHELTELAAVFTAIKKVRARKTA